MRKILLFLLFGVLVGANAIAADECGPLPTKYQMRLQNMEMYAFIHYSLNTYTDQEWGYGNEDPQLFNPLNLDVGQWVRTCKAAGMKGIIFTAKHHCGFCMWPSAYTDYSVKSSPWKNGQGDVVRELADACRKEGLRFAVYLSPWDRNHPEYGRPAYVEYFRNQLRELLTNYGDIFEVWFDGANGGDGWYGGARGQRKIDRLTYYGWDETYDMIRQLQPHCVIWNDGANRRGDLRWVGTEAGFIGETNWSLMRSDKDPQWEDLHYGMEDGDLWCPGETNTSIRPGWFYHQREDTQVKSVAKLMDTYYKSVGRNSTLLLNFPVMPNGLISPIDSLYGVEFRKAIDRLYDSKIDARLHHDGLTFTLDFGQPTLCNRFMAEEDITKGQRVRAFRLETLVDGQWVALRDQLVDAKRGTGLTTIGRKRIVCFPEVRATKLRMTITDSKCEPHIKNVCAFACPDEKVKSEKSEELKKSTDLQVSLKYASPRSVLVNLNKSSRVSAVNYMPPGRQDGQDGTITHYVLWAQSNDGKWSRLASREFSNIKNNPIQQTIRFQPIETHCLRLDAEEMLGGDTIRWQKIEVVTEK